MASEKRSSNFRDHGDHGDNDVSFEDLVHHEGMQKEKALARISKAKRERSNSNLSMMLQVGDKVVDRSARGDLQTGSTSEVMLDSDSESDKDEKGGKVENQEQEEKDEVADDLRKALFESIPEPYPHSTNFQRVIISEAADDPPDFDTKEVNKRFSWFLLEFNTFFQLRYYRSNA